MDSKRREISRQNSPHARPLPSYYSLSEQSHGRSSLFQRARYMEPEYGQALQGYARSAHHYSLSHPHPHSYPHPHPHSYPHPHPHPHLHLHPHPHPHPCDVHQSAYMEIEKERVRDEIILEISRRRALESEIRRELMMEREWALWRGSNGSALDLPPIMGFDTPMRLSHLGSITEGWPALSACERLEISHKDKEKLEGNVGGRFDSAPFQRRASDLEILEVLPAKEKTKEKEKIVLTEPHENISGSKRKSVTPPEVGDSELQPAILNKKSKVGWSCDLCQVNATSEKGLNEHMGGKKHRSKVAALAERAGKNYTIGLIPKKSTKSAHVETIDEVEVKRTSEPLVLESEKANPLKDDFLVDQVKKNVSDITPKVQNLDVPKKKKYKFWCELCHIGTLTLKIMNNHRTGKKHVSRLLRKEQNVETNTSNKKEVAALISRAEDLTEVGKKCNSKNVDVRSDEVKPGDEKLLNLIKPEWDGTSNYSVDHIRGLDEVKLEDQELLHSVKPQEPATEKLNLENIGKDEIIQMEN